MRGGQVVAAGGLTVAVLAAGVVIALTTTTGIDRADSTICPDGSQMGSLDGAGQRACTVDNTDQRDVTFGVVIRNTRRLPVTITDLPLDRLDRVGFTPHEVVEGRPPFRLESGEEREVLVRGRLPACEDRDTGGATTYDELAFQVRTLGVTRDATVSLDPTVRLVSQPC